MAQLVAIPRNTITQLKRANCFTFFKPRLTGQQATETSSTPRSWPREPDFMMSSKHRPRRAHLTGIHNFNRGQGSARMTMRMTMPAMAATVKGFPRPSSPNPSVNTIRRASHFTKNSRRIDRVPPIKKSPVLADRRSWVSMTSSGVNTSMVTI